MKAKLVWYLIVVLSFIFIGLAANTYGGQILAVDKTYIALGITSLYVFVSLWIGFCLHTGRAIPLYWARYAVGLMPALGLVGTLSGVVVLFGLGGEGGVDNAEAVKGFAIALYTTLAGFIFSEFLLLQLKVLDRG